MSTAIAAPKDSNLTLVADACLFTVAAVCLTFGFIPLALPIGFVAAWRLHERRIDRPAVVGAGLGFALGLAGVGGLIGLAALVSGGFSDRPEDFKLALPILLLLVTAGAAFLGLVVALGVDSLRDLARTRRTHVRLDGARLAATAVIVGFGVVVSRIQATNPQSEIGEAGIFALVAAAIAAIAMAVAVASVNRLAQRPSQP